MTSKDFEGGETNIKHAVAFIYTYESYGTLVVLSRALNTVVQYIFFGQQLFLAWTGLASGKL